MLAFISHLFCPFAKNMNIINENTIRDIVAQYYYDKQEFFLNKIRQLMCRLNLYYSNQNNNSELENDFFGEILLNIMKMDTSKLLDVYANNKLDHLFTRVMSLSSRVDKRLENGVRKSLLHSMTKISNYRNSNELDFEGLKVDYDIDYGELNDYENTVNAFFMCAVNYIKPQDRYLFNLYTGHTISKVKMYTQIKKDYERLLDNLTEIALTKCKKCKLNMLTQHEQTQIETLLNYYVQWINGKSLRIDGELVEFLRLFLENKTGARIKVTCDSCVISALGQLAEWYNKYNEALAASQPVDTIKVKSKCKECKKAKSSDKN